MKTDTQYQRVLPRDLFNEAKLLKCIGRLCLLSHDGQAPKNLQFDENGEPFIIGLIESGELTITNLEFTVADYPVIFKTVYNSKSNYPLICEYFGEETDVFDEFGDFTQEFLSFCESV